MESGSIPPSLPSDVSLAVPIARKVRLGETLAALIERSGYSRNRRKVAEAVGVSPGALSQYIHNQARPSLSTLVSLATFFNVSLDYLVYGSTAAVTVDYGPLARYIDHALAGVQARASRHSALVAELGQVIADKINDVAQQLANSSGAPSGFLTDDYLLTLERYSQATDLLSMDLRHELILIDGAEDAAGAFLPTMGANINRVRLFRSEGLTAYSPGLVACRSRE